MPEAPIARNTRSEAMSHERFNTLLAQACRDLNMVLNDQQTEQLYQYYRLFLKWNQAYNLSAIRDHDDVFYKHIVDSLSVAPYLQRDSATDIIDVGTGGGLPGIPLSICFPERRFTLLDSAGKKMRFLFQVRESLQLHHVTLENCRAEALRPEPLFDLVISRAFASLKTFTEVCQHLTNERGLFWAMKGQFPKQELSEIEKHYIVHRHHTLTVPGVQGERCLLEIIRRHSQEQAIT